MSASDSGDLKPDAKATGGCICGGVRYEVARRDKLRQVVACHCEQCRRFSGHFIAASGARYKYFRYLSDESLKWYAYKSGVRQGFCGECGCSLFFDYPGEERISIAAGTLDDSSGLVEKAHIYAGEAGCYYQPPEALVQDEWVALDCPE